MPRTIFQIEVTADPSLEARRIRGPVALATSVTVGV